MGQLELLEDQPGGRSIQILGCRRCGERRACRPGWSTRCHVCLDERTTDDVVNDWLRRYRTLPQDLGIALSEIEASVRESVHEEGRSAVLERDRAEAVAALVVADECERRTPDGWTLLATDLKGFPWFDDPALTESHGTWARHDACDSVQTLDVARGRTECRTCPPDPASRTHRARAHDPHLLYLVRTGRIQKFGHGDDRRVQAHVRGGADVVLVLEAAHHDVVRAEAQIKAQFKASRRVGRVRALPSNFGRGTEVLPASVAVDLTSVLDGVDVTDRFRRNG